ncbi:hypothetical protein BOSE127_180062 [Bosea sp. 127]|nr:hypothetical protein BOSE127_180062 [Bosea sp. 127]
MPSMRLTRLSLRYSAPPKHNLRSNCFADTPHNLRTSGGLCDTR